MVARIMQEGALPAEALALEHSSPGCKVLSAEMPDVDIYSEEKSTPILGSK